MEERDFQLIETMLFNGTIEHLDLHLNRLENSARILRFEYDELKVKTALDVALTGLAPGMHKVRLLLHKNGNPEITCTPLEVYDEAPLIALSKIHTFSIDLFLHHKTTRRRLYNEELAKAREKGFFDVIFLNESDEITEGAITNIYSEKTGILYTPPLECGLLDGTIRKNLILTGKAREKIIHLDDLQQSDRIYISNSIIGIREVQKQDRINYA